MSCVTHHETITKDFKLDAARVDVNAPTVHIGQISADNSSTENYCTTIKSNQLNLDGQEVTICAGSVIPANV